MYSNFIIGNILNSNENFEIDKSFLLEQGFDQVSLVRSMNRSANILVRLVKRLGTHFESGNLDRLGVYNIASQTSFYHREIRSFCDQERDAGSYQLYSSSITPRIILQTSVGLVASSLSIHFGIHGPINTFVDNEYAFHHALGCLIEDIKVGVVDAGIICGAFAFDDPIAMAGYHCQLFESGFAMIVDLRQAEAALAQVSKMARPEVCNFGIISSAIQFLKGYENC